MATLTVNMEDGLKEDFTVFCKETGLNPSVAVSMFARTVVREQRIPFEITTQNEREYEHYINESLRRGYEEVRAGKTHPAAEVFAKLEQKRGWA